MTATGSRRHDEDAVYETLPPPMEPITHSDPAWQRRRRAGNYCQSPVGLNAIVSCGAPWNWDCTSANGKISMTGTNSAKFVQNYGFFVSLAAYNNNPTVMCTSCHNQHIMNVVSVTAKNSGQTRATMRRCSSPSARTIQAAALPSRTRRAILPSMPRWRGQRVERSGTDRNDLLVC